MPTLFRQGSLYQKWNPTSQPPMWEPQEVDWSHSLSAGLVGCYLPTMLAGSISSTVASPIRDLSGVGPALVANSGDTLFSMTPAGLANMQSSGGSILGAGWYAAAVAAQKPSATASAFVVGYVTDGGFLNNYPPLIGLTYTSDAAASPYDAWNIRRPGSDATALSFSWNVGGTQGNVTVSGILSTGAIFRAGFTLNTNGAAGSARLFNSGSLVGSATASAGSINYGAAQTCFNGTPGELANSGIGTTVGYIWNRTLTDGEMAQLSAEPYVFLRPQRRRRWLVTSSGAGRSRLIQ